MIKPCDINLPFFSIVIPIYNRYELVIETVKSIFDQKYENFEIIIVNDGSTDGTREKLELTFCLNIKVRLINQQNLERAAARNRGFKESNGLYVVFLDSDDRLTSNHLSVLKSKIEECDFPDFIAAKFQFLRNNKRKDSSIVKYPEGYYDYRLFLEGNPLACNVCVKKSNSKLYLFFEDRRYSIKEDWVFFLQNLRHQKLYLVDQVTILMLDHERRSMRGNNELLIEKTFLAMAWIVSNINLNVIERKALSAHVNYFCAIHSYLDFQQITGLRFIIGAIYLGGLRLKYIVLLIKILIGRKSLELMFYMFKK